MSSRARKGQKIEVRLPGGTTRTFIDRGYIDLDKEVVLDENGERYTEARAQADAERILERVYGRIGRPSLDGSIAGGQKSPHLSFRVPEQLAERAAEVAAREGKSLSQLGRDALEKYLDAAAEPKKSRRRSA
jgi:hypothetical protein